MIFGLEKIKRSYRLCKEILLLNIFGLKVGKKFVFFYKDLPPFYSFEGIFPKLWLKL